jgi:hypothetical protein
MPAPDRPEPGYRTDPGTSIAVRLDPAKERGEFDIHELLNSYVSCPPIPVELDGQRVGGTPAILIDRPWFERQSIRLQPRQLKQLEEHLEKRLNRKFTEPPSVELLPIDLTKSSPTGELKGQLMLALFSPTKEWLELSELHRGVEGLTYVLTYEPSTRTLLLKIEAYTKASTNRETLGTIDIQLPAGELPNILESLESKELAWLSHNGVSVPTSQSELYPKIVGDEVLYPTWAHGVIALTDSLRPKLSISRDQIISIPWNVYSVGGLALYRALDNLDVDLRAGHWELLTQSPSRFRGALHLGELMEDKFLHADDGWPSMPIIRTDSGFMSLLEIQRAFNDTDKIEIFLPSNYHWGSRSFLDWCTATLIQLRLEPSVELMGPWGEHRLFVSNTSHGPITEGHKLFPPLTFVPFLNSTLLRPKWEPFINLNHSFSGWLLNAAPEVSRRYPGLFGQIRSSLLGGQPEESVQNLNTALDRLRELHPNVRPPKNLVLKEEDFAD